MSGGVGGNSTTGAAPSVALKLERAYWEHHEDYDWSSDATKRNVFARIPDLAGDILELCVGGGAFTRAIPDGYASYTGIDLSQSLLRALRERLPRVAAVHGDAQDLPFRDGAFETIVVFSGLHHLPQYRHAIAECHRVLRPGGHFFCFEPNDRAWYRAPMRFLRERKVVRDIIRIYSEDEIYLDPRTVAGILEAGGFGEIRTTYLTPRFRPGFLNAATLPFAWLMYAAGGMGSSIGTQSYFAMSGRRR